MIPHITEEQFKTYATQTLNEAQLKLPEKLMSDDLSSKKEMLSFLQIFIKPVVKRHAPSLTEVEINRLLSHPPTLEFNKRFAGKSKNPISVGTEFVNWIIDLKNAETATI